MWLKHTTSDVDSLYLTFSVIENYFDKPFVVELKENGHQIAVTNENKIEYIMLYANYLLNKRI